MAAPDWPGVEFTTSREATIRVGGTDDEPELRHTFTENSIAVLASTMIGGRLARAVVLTDTGTAGRLSDAEAIESKRAALVRELAALEARA